VVGDEERAIVDALNALRHRCTYVFTTGGIGPTHDDITADSVAKAFRMPIDVDPRALAILHEWLKATGAEMNEARLRMTRIPKGADLVLNKVSGAPGFWIGNVIVMAGVPSIMQAMLDEVAPKLKTSVRMLSETCARMRARATSARSLMRSPRPTPRSRSAAIRSSIRSTGPTRMWCCAPAMHRSSRLPNARSRTCWSGCGGHNRGAADGVSQQRRRSLWPGLSAAAVTVSRDEDDTRDERYTAMCRRTPCAMRWSRSDGAPRSIWNVFNRDRATALKHYADVARLYRSFLVARRAASPVAWLN
jgi:hypothetical protein